MPHARHQKRLDLDRGGPAIPVRRLNSGNHWPTRSVSYSGVIKLEGFAVLRTVLLIVLIILLIGALPTWPYSAGWGYYPTGGLGTILVVLIVLALLGVI
jgi:hypothetical protein